MEPQHPLLTSLHPQFVAAKSLIFNSSGILLTLHSMWMAWKCYLKIKIVLFVVDKYMYYCIQLFNVRYAIHLLGGF